MNTVIWMIAIALAIVGISFSVWLFRKTRREKKGVVPDNTQSEPELLTTEKMLEKYPPDNREQESAEDLIGNVNEGIQSEFEKNVKKAARIKSEDN